MNLAAILMEMAAFAALFTAIVLTAYRGDRKHSVAGIHNYPPDIQEEYFKTHERMEVSYRSKKVVLTKGIGICIFTVILMVCAKLAGAVTFRQGFGLALALGLMVWIGVIYLGIDGIKNGYGFWKLTLRFIVLLYVMKAFDIFVQDQWLVMTVGYFKKLYPESADCDGWKDRGFNNKKPDCQNHCISLSVYDNSWDVYAF